MIYFDNAATSFHKPDGVAKAVFEAINTMGNPGRGAHSASLGASRTVYDTRRKLAKLFNAESAERIAFTANATMSLNIAIKGVLNPGDHVITTALEHNSVLRPLYEMENEGVELTIVSSDIKGNIDYDDMEKSIKPNTKAIVTTHASNLTGNVIDVKRVGEIAKNHGLMYIVDASQTAGVLSTDVRDMNIDILCFTGHKGLMGTQGTGGIYVKPGVNIKNLLSGGSGVHSYDKTHPQQMPTALEAGTLNTHGIAGLNAALTYIENMGTEAIYQKEKELMYRFYNGIKDVPNVKIYGDFEADIRCAIVTINIGDYDSGKISDVLFEQYGISTRAGAHCAPLMHKALGTEKQGAVRFSFSHFNTFEEIDIAVKAIKELAE